MAYDNILKALGQPSPALTAQQQADNYSAFSDIMRAGISLPDLLKRLDAVESELKAVKDSRGQEDARVFSAMEAAVRDVQSVKDADRLVRTERARVLADLCMRDPAYREAAEEYRRAVQSAYVDKQKQ